MNLYSLIRPLLFHLEPETAHHVTLNALRLGQRIGLSALFPKGAANRPRRVMGIDFPNPVGLAAGLDKNGDCIDGLAMLGFGFIEIGTVTPRPQPGNPPPRMFRIPQARAIINRMGFNNKGVDYLVERVKQAQHRGVLGINIGKNFDTPLERAGEDYLIGLRTVYPHADYITINISSPNTKQLRQLQQGSELASLLSALKAEQARLQAEHGRYVPLVVKIAPDLNDDEIRHIANLLLAHAVDGVIATNATIAREGVAGLPSCEQTGGLSGAPLKPQATHVVAALASELSGRVPIIAAGGILSGGDALEKIEAGASLVQLYTGLIYRGPSLVHEVLKALQESDERPIRS
jgi:dihydroorotate dehydrogenase